MNRVTVIAKPGSRHARVVRRADGRYEIAVTAPAERGKANDAVRRALADALGVAPSRVSLRMGISSHVKVFDIT